LVASLDALLMAALSDDELLDVMVAWRRVTSWAQASELAVVAEFVRRRQEASPSSPPVELGEFVADEIALALTLSGGAAGIWAGLAGKLADPEWFPLTGRALAEGRIDLTRAKAIVDGLFGVDTGTIGLVEAAVIDDAQVLNAGRLRHRVREALTQVDPQAAAQRKERARKVRSLQVWGTAAGTCDLALREVSQEDAEAIYNKINAVAQAMKSDGDVRPIDAIRHDLGVALLRGTPLPEASRDLRRDGDDDQTFHNRQHEREDDQAEDSAGSCGSGCGRNNDQAEDSAGSYGAKEAEDSAGSVDRGSSGGRPGGGVSPEKIRGPRSSGSGGSAGDGLGAVAMVAGRLTDLLAGVIDQRLSAIAGQDKAAGRRIGLALRVAAAMQAMTSALDELKLRWCDATITGHGATLAQGSAGMTGGDTSSGPASGRATGGQAAAGRTGGAGGAACGVHGHDGYRPPAGMRRLVQQTYQICAFPSCNRKATRCDLDHTVAFHKGGPTCSCNLSPLCRHHHKLKQNPQWHLFQPWPGLLVWVTPAGKWHTVIPENRQ
jgi:hypothetical protein